MLLRASNSRAIVPTAAANKRAAAPIRARAPRIVAAAGGDGNGRGSSKESKKEKAVEELVAALQKGGVKKEIARRVIDKWEEAGVADDPRALRKLFLRQSAAPILGTVLQAAIDAAAAYSIFSSAAFFDAGPPFWGKGVVVILLDVLAGYFATGVVFDLATLVAVLVTTARVGTSADSFAAALKRIAGESRPATGINVLDKAQAAVDAIKVAQALDAISSMLDKPGGGATNTLASLSALLTLSRSEKNGFDPARLSMTEAEAAELALKFSQYDLNDDGRLDKPEVRRMAGQLGIDLSTEEAAAAIEAMDKNSDGLIEFSEWAEFYANRKGRVPANAK